MHFLPDVYVPCEQCGGKRYNRETLDVRFKGRTIADVLDMPVEEALDFFSNIPKIKRRLQALHDVGLDYIRLGQPATTLSGGEAQRVKLATELAKVATGETLYILDEPTTGLHFADVQRLLEMLDRLVEQGNTVVVIEHNLDVIKTADRIIDLGPEGGEEGGKLVAAGTPEEVAAVNGLLHRPLPGRDREAEAARPSAGARRTGEGRRRGAARGRPREALLRRSWLWYERNRLPWRRARIHLPHAPARGVHPLPRAGERARGARRRAARDRQQHAARAGLLDHDRRRGPGRDRRGLLPQPGRR